MLNIIALTTSSIKEYSSGTALSDTVCTYASTANVVVVVHAECVDLHIRMFMHLQT